MISNLLTRAPLRTCVRVSTLLVILSLGSLAQSTHAGGSGHGVSGNHGRGGGFQGHGAPEIDPMLAGAGVLVLVGGTLVLMGRRRPARARGVASSYLVLSSSMRTSADVRELPDRLLKG